MAGTHVMNPVMTLRIFLFYEGGKNTSTHLLVNEAQEVFYHIFKLFFPLISTLTWRITVV